MIHRIKTIQPFFDKQWDGTKTFEVRKNDREYKEGDQIYSCEYDCETDKFSGREVILDVLYVLHGYPAIQEGYVVFSTKTVGFVHPNS